MIPEGSSSRSQSVLSKIWHVTDNLRFMDPLPPAHRRGIILALIVMLLAFLWPSSPSVGPASRPAQQGSGNEVPLQADIYNNDSNQSDPSSSPPAADSQGEWRSFQIASGQTLAQLFRDNNLPVNDVFAMAQVEGDDKPLSTLRTGQNVKIREDDQGVVTGLTVETDNGPILFTRQPDGSFIRAR
ncbi:Opacity-associated protein A [Winslowiella iniecta]|uniref:Opacity-associated protein A n=2 Tax=Winslowiella iniecta TaxID=1560201 RepID=A0A0L7T5V1_9GAMM|nr:Opacity-associated protein A [Winslowiella iniecta]KOC93146.1 Opacity-associated protein A [Winslowiella iniecta]